MRTKNKKRTPMTDEQIREQGRIAGIGLEIILLGVADIALASLQSRGLSPKDEVDITKNRAELRKLLDDAKAESARR